MIFALFPCSSCTIRGEEELFRVYSACEGGYSPLLRKRALLGQANYGAMLDGFAGAGASDNKNVRSAWASFLVNGSLLLTTQAQADGDGVLIAMSAVAELLNNSPEGDDETNFRHGPIN